MVNIFHRQQNNKPDLEFSRVIHAVCCHNQRERERDDECERARESYILDKDSLVKGVGGEGSTIVVDCGYGSDVSLDYCVCSGEPTKVTRQYQKGEEERVKPYPLITCLFTLDPGPDSGHILYCTTALYMMIMHSQSLPPDHLFITLDPGPDSCHILYCTTALYMMIMHSQSLPPDHLFITLDPGPDSCHILYCTTALYMMIMHSQSLPPDHLFITLDPGPDSSHILYCTTALYMMIMHSQALPPDHLFITLDPGPDSCHILYCTTALYMMIMHSQALPPDHLFITLDPGPDSSHPVLHYSIVHDDNAQSSLAP
ncbi:hypothetical protein J6590_020558 [Homalodisca vitripennis]|nr:hypothetical protein J6590_020558 [Homalodisca vitripennis]